MSKLGWKDWLAAKGYDLDAVNEMEASARDELLERLNAEWRVDAERATKTRSREDEIRDALARYSLPYTDDETPHGRAKKQELEAIADRAISESWTTQRAEVEMLRQSRVTGPMQMTPKPASNIDENVVACAIGLTAGVSESALLAAGTDPDVLQRTRDNRQLSGLSLHGLVRHALRSMGEDVTGRIHDGHVQRALHPTAEMMAASQSIVSVSGILSNIANKSLLGAYAQAPAPWRLFAAKRNVANFKTATAYRPSMSVVPELLAPGGEVKHGTAEEESYTYSVKTYAKQLSIDRTDFVNDDLSAFSTVLPAMGRGAARKLNDLVATTILANTGTFWGVSNSNYISGSTTNISAAGLDQATQKLRQMKDAEGNYLDLAPAVLLVSAGLESTSRALLQSDELLRSIASADNLPSGNIWQGFAQLAVEPRLADTGFTGYSTTAWWLFSAPENAAVVVAFLDGRETPVTEMFDFSADIDRLAMGWRIYHDFGCALADKRASIMSKGAA